MTHTKKGNYWISAGKFSLLERVSILGFGFGNFYMLVRIFDKEFYGVWLLFVSVTTLMEIARNGLFRNPLVRFLNTANDQEKVYLQNGSMLLNLIFSFSAAFILYLLSFPLSKHWGISDFEVLFLYNLAANIALPFFFHFEYILAANFDFRASFLGNLVRNGSIFLMIAYYFLTAADFDLEQLALYYVLSVFLGALVNLFTTRKYLVRPFIFNKEKVLELLHYGKYTLGTNIAATLLRNIDVWMLAWFISPASVAVYNVAVRISNLFEVPVMALASILFPEAAKRSSDEGDGIFKDMYEKSVAAILLLSIPMTMIVLTLPELIIQVLAGSEYSESVEVLRITIFFGLIMPFNKQMGILLDAVGKAKINMYFVILAAALNAVMNAALIPIFGTSGAATATLSTFFLIVVLNLIYIKREFGVEVTNIPRYMITFIRRIKDKLIPGA